MIENITDLFVNGGGLAIPRYIVLKDGKVVEAHAKGSSEKEALYRQIEQYL